MTMYDASDNDIVVDEGEIHGVRKMRNQCAPFLAVNGRKGHRKLANPFNGRGDRASKALPQLGLALFKPPLGLQQFALGSRPEDHLAVH